MSATSAAEVILGAAASVVTPLSPTLGAVLSLIDALLTESPELISEVENLVNLAKGKPSTQAPLDFKDSSAALAKALAR